MPNSRQVLRKIKEKSGADRGSFLGGGSLLRNGVADWQQNATCTRKP